jgi:hypothetical protein
MAAGSTYTKIASTTLGSATASVTFSSISSAYTDLILVVNGSATANNTATIQFNSDSASNYSSTGIYGDGSTAASYRVANATFIGIGEFYTTNSNIIVQIQNYANTTSYKTTLDRANTAGYSQAIVGTWRSTSAINNVITTMFSTTFVTGTTFNLYGIAAA